VLRAWTIGAIYSFESGLPYSAYVDDDINGDRNRFNDIAPGTTRNQYRMPKQITLDARLARNIGLTGNARLMLIWEVFNAMNKTNYTAVNNTLYAVTGTTLHTNALFGQPLEQGEPRMMRIAARVEW
jgi:hypothetical protein